jgi:DNA primase
MFNTDELKNISIIEVAKRLGIQVKNEKAMCFNNHDRKTPSLSFNTRENYWNCFGCNQGGDSIRLVQKYYGCSFEEACTWLSKEFNIPFNLKSTRVKSISKTSKVHNFTDYRISRGK